MGVHGCTLSLICWLKSNVGTREVQHLTLCAPFFCTEYSNSIGSLWIHSHTLNVFVKEGFVSGWWPRRVLMESRSLYIFIFFQSGLKSLECGSRFPDWRHARPGVHSKIALMAKLGKSERTGGMFKATNTVAGWYLFLLSLYAPRSCFQQGSVSSRRWLLPKSENLLWSDHKVFKRPEQLPVSWMKNSFICVSGFLPTRRCSHR